MIMKKRTCLQITTLVVLALGTLAGRVSGEVPATQPSTVTVAVMDFESKAPGNPEFGQQIAEILTIRLSMVDAVTVVDRSRLTEILDEHKLKLRGLTDQEQAAEVGKLLGAQIMVFGKVFPVGDELYVTMKLVGVETGQITGAIARGKMSEDLSAILDRSMEELTACLEREAASLVPGRGALPDPIQRLADQLRGKPLPRVAVVVPEEHLSHRIPDPAAETEIARILAKIGCEVAAVDEAAAKAVVRDAGTGSGTWPAALQKIDLVVVGEAFSETAGRYQGLVSGTARAEVKVVDRKTVSVILAARATERAVDLSENIAAKTALQKCGHTIGLEIARDIAARRTKVAG